MEQGIRAWPELDCGDGIKLRQWREDDVSSLVKYANNRNVSRNLRDIFPYPYTREDANTYLGRDRIKNSRLAFAIEVDGEAVGGIGLHIQDDVARRSAEIGYWLGEPFWNRGIMTAAVKAMTEYGFKQFGLVRIYANVFEWNPASARVLEKTGYQLEGRRRKAVTKDGQTMDDFMYAIVRE